MKNNKPGLKPFFSLDVRQVTAIFLGKFHKVREALNKRAELGVKFGHIFTGAEFVSWLAVLSNHLQLKDTLKKHYFYLDGRDNSLVYLGQFKDHRAAKMSSLTTHFGVPQLFIVDGDRLLTTLTEVRDMVVEAEKKAIAVEVVQLEALRQPEPERKYQNDWEGQVPEPVPTTVQSSDGDIVTV